MQTQQTKEEIVMDVALSRHRTPKIKNGAVRFTPPRLIHLRLTKYY
jgi:hypothetical protein